MPAREKTESTAPGPRADEGEGAVALHGGLEKPGVEGGQPRNVVADQSNAVKARSHPATVAEQPGEA
jgi:hypothetical protein